MPALAEASARPVLTVIQGGLSKSEAWRVQEAELEIEARRFEELAMSAQLMPIVRRLRVDAQAAGGRQFRDISALIHLLGRHERRWLVEEQRAA